MNFSKTLPYIVPSAKWIQYRFQVILFLFSFFLAGSLQAKKVVIGTGSGSITQTSMTGLAAGDTLAITPGTYAGGATFSDLHDLTIINNGGVVTFTGTVIWGGSKMHNIKWTGVGYTGAFYGFVFNTGRAIYGQTTHTDSTRFDHIDFANASTSAFDFGDSNYGTTYNGSTASLKMHCMTFSDIRVINSAMFIITGYTDVTVANNNICDSIDMHNIIIKDLQGPGQQVRGNMTHFNMYNWNITYAGTNTQTGDQGILYVSGNGSIHHNYMHGGRGYLARVVGFSLKPLQDSVLFYNNIILSTTHYGGFDIRCDTLDVPWRNSTTFNPIKNVYVLNNTVGNKWNQGFVVPVVVEYQMLNNNILYCKNNLSFAADPNVTNLPGEGILVDYNQANGNKIDSSNNRYFSAPAILNYLQDTLATCRPKAVSSLNGGGVPFNFLITDFYNNIRPTPPSIGAVEYAGITSTVIANAGPNQTISLPLDSVTLTGLASTAINSTITSYQWAQVSGPSIAKINTPNSGTTIAATLKAGVYVFGLLVKNNNNDSSAATVTITVNPQNFPPVVSAGTNQTITLPTSSVTLTGTATDATGTIASYLWTQVSGPNTATITSKAAITTTVTGLIAGAYVFQLQATDNLGLSGTATVNITVNPQNLPPVVSAGLNQTISLPTSSATLTGTATSASGTISSILWSQVSGPNTATIGTKAALSTSVSGLIAGVYVFQLQATDNLGLTGTSTVSITVIAQNFPPVVSAGASQTIRLPTSSVTLTGTATDATGTIASYLWTQVSGPNTGTISSKATLSTRVTGLIAGVYVFKLTVTDNLGAAGSATVTITVNPRNLPPVVSAGTNQTITLPTSTATLTGTATDATGTVTTILWTQVSGPNTAAISTKAALTTNISGLVAGSYVFQLRATDNLGLSATSSVTITVVPSTPVNNLPPVANAGANQTITAPVSGVTVDGSSSTDPDGSIATFAWQQISGPSTSVIANPNAAITTITSLVPGVYVFKLTVTDNLGLSATASITVTVNQQNFPPVVNAGTNQTIAQPNSTAILSGSATDATGTITTYLWTQVSGPNNALIASSSTTTTIVSGLITGSYVFQLMATDNTGLSGTGSVTITVIPATPVANVPPIANAGTDQTITSPISEISVDGSLSSDPDGSIATNFWEQFSGPSTSTITDPNASKTTITGLFPGVYVFKLTVTDNLGLSSSAQIVVTVNVATALNPVIPQGSETTALVFPNPATSIMNLQVINNVIGSMTVSIIDVNGRLLQTQKLNKNASKIVTPINVSALANGAYFLIMNFDKSANKDIKFIKQ